MINDYLGRAYIVEMAQGFGAMLPKIVIPPRGDRTSGGHWGKFPHASWCLRFFPVITSPVIYIQIYSLRA